MMRMLGTSLLVMGLAVLLVVGLLRVIRDLLSRSVFADPESAGGDSGFSSLDDMEDMRKGENAGN
jgi:hypothetical protein